MVYPVSLCFDIHTYTQVTRLNYREETYGVQTLSITIWWYKTAVYAFDKDYHDTGSAQRANLEHFCWILSNVILVIKNL